MKFTYKKTPKAQSARDFHVTTHTHKKSDTISEWTESNLRFTCSIFTHTDCIFCWVKCLKKKNDMQGKQNHHLFRSIFKPCCLQSYTATVFTMKIDLHFMCGAFKITEKIYIYLYDTHTHQHSHPVGISKMNLLNSKVNIMHVLQNVSGSIRYCYCYAAVTFVPRFMCKMWFYSLTDLAILLGIVYSIKKHTHTQTNRINTFWFFFLLTGEKRDFRFGGNSIFYIVDVSFVQNKWHTNYAIIDFAYNIRLKHEK